MKPFKQTLTPPPRGEGAKHVLLFLAVRSSTQDMKSVGVSAISGTVIGFRFAKPS